MLGAWVWGGSHDSYLQNEAASRHRGRPDMRSDTLRQAETLFEYIDRDGEGVVGRRAIEDCQHPLSVAGSPLSCFFYW